MKQSSLLKANCNLDMFTDGQSITLNVFVTDLTSNPMISVEVKAFAAIIYNC